MTSSNLLNNVGASAAISSLAAGFISHPIGFVGGAAFGAIREVSHFASTYAIGCDYRQGSDDFTTSLWLTAKKAAVFFATTAATWQALLAAGFGMPFTEVVMLSSLSMLAQSALVSVARAFNHGAAANLFAGSSFKSSVAKPS